MMLTDPRARFRSQGIYIWIAIALLALTTVVLAQRARATCYACVAVPCDAGTPCTQPGCVCAGRVRGVCVESPR